MEKSWKVWLLTWKIKMFITLVIIPAFVTFHEPEKLFHNFESNWYLETYFVVSKADCFVDYSKVDIGFTTECCESCEEESVRQTDPRLPSVLQKLPKSSCCQAAEQDCRSVSTIKKSCIPGSSTYIWHRQEQDTSKAKDYAVSMIDKERDHFVNFDPVKSLMNIWMHETMAGKDVYSKLWNVVRMLLVLSHGQAAVERGFSINKQVICRLRFLLPRELSAILWGMWVALTRLM